VGIRVQRHRNLVRPGASAGMWYHSPYRRVTFLPSTKRCACPSPEHAPRWRVPARNGNSPPDLKIPPRLEIFVDAQPDSRGRSRVAHLHHAVLHWRRHVGHAGTVASPAQAESGTRIGPPPKTPNHRRATSRGDKAYGSHESSRVRMNRRATIETPRSAAAFPVDTRQTVR